MRCSWCNQPIHGLYSGLSLQEDGQDPFVIAHRGPCFEWIVSLAHDRCPTALFRILQHRLSLVQTSRKHNVLPSR